MSVSVTKAKGANQSRTIRLEVPDLSERNEKQRNRNQKHTEARTPQVNVSSASSPRASSALTASVPAASVPAASVPSDAASLVGAREMTSAQKSQEGSSMQNSVSSANKNPVSSVNKNPVSSVNKNSQQTSESKIAAAYFAKLFESDPAGESEANSGFDPSAPELATTWSSFATSIYCLNTYPNGITLSVHQNDSLEEVSPLDVATHAKENDPITSESQISLSSTLTSKYLPNQFHLRFRDTRDYQVPSGKYYLHRDNYLQALEGHLSQLHKNGQLSSSVLYFGSVTDPFLNLHKKFDVTMGSIEIVERYAPGQVIFQTRSPMVISILPALKSLGAKASVVIPIESFVEKAIARYTPGKPRIGERLVAADGLRKQGVRVNLAVSPVLPYGDYFRDAWDFAELLARHADYITFGSLASGAESEVKHLRTMPVAQKLVADKQFRYLRPHSYLAVYKALQQIAPEKLLLPIKRPSTPSQLNLFVA